MRKLSQLLEECRTLREIDKATGETVLIDEWKKELSQDEIDLIGNTISDLVSNLAPISNLFKNLKLSLDYILFPEKE